MICSYLEIYNESVVDLLDVQLPKLNLKEDKKNNVVVENCKEVQVFSIKDIMDLIKTGLKGRHIAATNMNAESSRSHAIFSAVIRMETTLNDSEKVVKSSKFNIVDLAGCESLGKTGA